ncbi:hypothetical protein EVAR_2971_1 [Eumeta japonica]|uniref:Uncharacterized protein n=1 Tax=Eumeta variegata TaxID=151549 RepID=A0A4C1STD7_EUMVA|nr:hypothetical protein EVAR_2971_1 [Eumeta japonica]
MGHPFQSAVHLLACRSALLDSEQSFTVRQVVRDVILSDHNAVTFNMRTEWWPSLGLFRGTLIYNMAKAQVSEFVTAFDTAKEEWALTDRPTRWDRGVVWLYNECIQV